VSTWKETRASSCLPREAEADVFRSCAGVIARGKHSSLCRLR
jgi:hypothetical protein